MLLSRQIRALLISELFNSANNDASYNWDISLWSLWCCFTLLQHEFSSHASSLSRWFLFFIKDKLQIRLRLFVYVWFYSVGNMESPSAVNWLSSTRLYMIIRASAGYGWVNNFQHPLSAVIIKQASLWSPWRWDNQLPLSTSYVVSGAYGIKINVLINYTSILVRRCRESVMCEIKSLLTVTLLNIFHSVTENGGGVLR